MKLPDRTHFTGPLIGLAFFVAVAATLRFAQDFFVPLVLAGLLSFLISPYVRLLERWRLGRVGAVLATTAIAFVLIGSLTYLVTSQFLDLAASLPKYRSNLISRVASLKTNENNPLRLAVRTITDVTSALNKPEESPSATRPVRVEIVQPADGSVQMLMGVLWPIVGPIADTMVVIVIVIFMLLAGGDLRDRLTHLLGRGRLRVTTQAFDEAGLRISRYLRAELIVNASFGIAIGIGLFAIGIPNAIFWGLLATVLRFLPYIGPWLAAILPIALSIAVFESWTPPLLTIGLFVVCELISNNVIEPWLYGSSTEISPLAVIVSALFWTWLWGGVGLVLATPLTVCFAVAGKYLPDLAFLDLLIGEKPSISAADRLYQRLLALNEEAASDIVERHATEHGVLSAFDAAVLPSLRNLELDFRADALSEEASADARQILREIVADLAKPGTEVPPPTVLCIPAMHESDELAAQMLAQMLAETNTTATVLPPRLPVAETIELAVAAAPKVICISTIALASTVAARVLCNRLHTRLPDTRILIGLWQPEGGEFTARRERLRRAGASETCPDLAHTLADITAFFAATQPPPASATIV